MRLIVFIAIASLMLLGSGLSCGRSSETDDTDDTAGPKISSFTVAGTDVSASASVTDVAVGAALTIVFDEEILESSLSGNITLKPTTATDGTADAVTALSLSEDQLTVTVSHGELAPGVGYTLTASNSITDLAGNALTTSELATFSVQEVTTGGTSVSLAFTTSSTAGSNNPTVKVMIPSADTEAVNQIGLVFSASMDADSVSTSSVKVTTEADTSTNLCSSLTASGTTVTCTLSSSIACNGTPAKYLVTVNADPKTETGSHSTVPYSGYFSNIDDNFRNSETIANCWTISIGEDSVGGAVSGEVFDADGVNDAKLTLQGASNTDLSDDADSSPGLAKNGLSLSGIPFGVAIKIDTFSTVDAAAEGFEFIVSDDNGGGEGDFTFEAALSGDSKLLAFAENDDTEEELMSPLVDSTAVPLYFCMTRNASGTVYTFGYAEGGSANAFTDFNLTGAPTLDLSGAIQMELSLDYGSSNATVVVDWVRWNIGSATCPTITDVEG